MDPILSYTIWMSLPADTRHKLSMLFNIPKSGSTTVEYRSTGNVVTSDGYTPDDLRAITVAKLQKFLRTDETDFYALVETAIENIDAIIELRYEPFEPEPTAKDGEPRPPREHKVQKKRAQKKREKLGEMREGGVHEPNVKSLFHRCSFAQGDLTSAPGADPTSSG